jgi:hypothetical protein
MFSKQEKITVHFVLTLVLLVTQVISQIAYHVEAIGTLTLQAAA